MPMLASLIADVLAANRALPRLGLVTLTWGNVSGIDRSEGLVVIKASGVGYENMTPSDMVVVDLDGNVVSGERRPSTDTPTHVALYRAFDELGGIVHSHSTWATSWAQAQREIPLLGTTHADLSAYPIPVTRPLTARGDRRRLRGRDRRRADRGGRRARPAPGPVRARARTRAVLLGRDRRGRRRGGGHARGGGARWRCSR